MDNAGPTLGRESGTQHSLSDTIEESLFSEILCRTNCRQQRNHAALQEGEQQTVTVKIYVFQNFIP